MYKKQYIGKYGENFACDFLEKNGYKIIERNFSCSQGEIDIIAYDKKQNEIVFVEVKTRTNFNYGFPSESINKIKKKHMKKSVEYYIYKKNLYNYYLRFDVIEIVFQNQKYKLNHIKNVFL